MIDKALSFYDFDSPYIEFIRHNENMTYKVADNGKLYVLRIHKPSEGFDTNLLNSGKKRSDLILDELGILQYLAEKGKMQTQRVKRNTSGESLTMLDSEIPVTVLEWIDGKTLDDLTITVEIAYKLGAMIGGLHNDLAHCKFKHRYFYDNELLIKMIDEADQFSKQTHIQNSCSDIICRTAHC